MKTKQNTGKKWFAWKPEGYENFWYVDEVEDDDAMGMVATCYGMNSEENATTIVNEHNAGEAKHNEKG